MSEPRWHAGPHKSGEGGYVACSYCTGYPAPTIHERVDGAVALSKVLHDLVPGIRHDIGLEALEALASEGWSLRWNGVDDEELAVAFAAIRKR